MGREINPTRRVFADQTPQAGIEHRTMINLSRKLPLESKHAAVGKCAKTVGVTASVLPRFAARDS